MTTAPTPIDQNTRTDVCSMRRAGQEVRLTSTFENAEVESGHPFAEGQKVTIQRARSCKIEVEGREGDAQVLVLDGEALTLLRAMLLRMYGAPEAPSMLGEAIMRMPRGG